MRQVSKNLARVRAQVALVLSQIQGVLRCSSDICGVGEQSLVSGLYDGDVGGGDGAVLARPGIERTEQSKVGLG